MGHSTVTSEFVNPNSGMESTPKPSCELVGIPRFVSQHVRTTNLKVLLVMFFFSLLQTRLTPFISRLYPVMLHIAILRYQSLLQVARRVRQYFMSVEEF